MFQLNADGRHRPGDFKRRLARVAGGWLRFAAWRLATVTGEFLSPARLRALLRGRRRTRRRSGAGAPPGDERLDRFN